MTLRALRVLVIEDNPGDVRLLDEMMAEPAGQQVRLAHAGTLAAGLEALHRDPFDAVLLDLSLPDSHGLETVARLKGSAPSMPVVIMTSLDDEDTATRAVAEGAQDYLVKGRDVERRTVARAVQYAIERQYLHQQLAEAREMDALGRLAGAVAHEYNNLLMTILGCSEMLLDEVADRPELAELVTTIQRSSQRAATVTEQVLGVGGRKRLACSSLPLNGAIRATKDMLRETLGDGLSVTLRLDAEFDAVMFDAREVERIVGILALNALEDGCSGGFEIRTANELLDDTAARALGMVAGLSVVLIATYFVSAMSAAPPNALLEPIVKPRGAPGSTGLGLASVKGMLRACGASMTAACIPGGGTTFTIHFPHRGSSLPPKTVVTT